MRYSAEAYMAQEAYFRPELFKFLKELRKNNNRAWFLANKDRYESAVRDPCLRFIADLKPHIRKISPHFEVDSRPTGGSLMRIYRDTRFSKDKSPYKTNVGMHFPHRSHSKDSHQPGFYLHLQPGGCFGGGGLWHPDASNLKKIRGAIVSRPRDWQAVLRGGVAVEGATLKRTPLGFDPDHPFIKDLKRKDFIT